MIGAAIGLASNAISGIIGLAQMNKANKQIKTAQNAQRAAMDQFRSIKEQNPYAAVQVPTQSYTNALDRNQAFMTNALQASQGAGAEGVIGAAGNIAAANQAGNLDIAAQQAEAVYNRDVVQAEAQSGINQRQATRQEDLSLLSLNQAQSGLETAQANKLAGFEGLTSGITGAMGGISSLVGLYGKNKGNKGTRSIAQNQNQWSATGNNNNNTLLPGQDSWMLGAKLQ